MITRSLDDMNWVWYTIFCVRFYVYGIIGKVFKKSLYHTKSICQIKCWDIFCSVQRQWPIKKLFLTLAALSFVSVKSEMFLALASPVVQIRYKPLPVVPGQQILIVIRRQFFIVLRFVRDSCIAVTLSCCPWTPRYITPIVIDAVVVDIWSNPSYNNAYQGRADSPAILSNFMKIE